AWLTVLGVVRPGGARAGADLAADASPLRGVGSRSPVDAVIAEAAGHDLTVLGVGEGWQLEPSVFGFRSERLAAECPSSLLIVRGRPQRAAAPASRACRRGLPWRHPFAIVGCRFSFPTSPPPPTFPSPPC